MKTNVLLQKMKFQGASLRLMVLAMVALIITGSAVAQTTVVDVIVNSPDHTTLETAVIAAGLDDDLSGPGPFTVFAPTDDAFDALPDGVLDDLLADPEGALAQVLLYHVVNASVASTDLTNGQFATTMHGDSIVVTISGADVFINNVKVTTADIAADNGIVHVVDAVLVPGSTVYEVIAGSADHNTLEAGITTAGLQGTLSGPGPFTVFAPTDDAFAALPDGVLDALLADPDGALTDVLLYHVIGDTVASSDLINGQFAATINGDSVVVTISGSDVFINNAMVSTADITTDNGIVHVIDAVLVPGSTVYEVIAGSADHNTLEAGITTAGLQGTLSGPGPFTVFAPTDAAFEALDEGVLEALLADPEGALTNVLLYHVVGAKAMSGDLSDGQMIATLNGDSVMVSIVDGSVYINDAMVTIADIEADNGVVHVIDMVLVPAFTVFDVISASPIHNTLEEAIIAAELDDDLSGEGPFTVFAPTDDAFAALPEGTLDALLADPTGELAQILLYHVVAAKAMSGDLSDGQMITTLEGTDVTVTISEGNVFINDAQVIVPDVEADNGVVHIIDAVLTPSTSIRERMIDEAGVTIYPNPAREFVNIEFEVIQPSGVKLEMYDMLGQQVRMLDQGFAYEGSYSVEFPVADLESGIYILIINTGKSQIANKVRVVK
jgi:uncharacterized surface protein with fasciclin (FAS1) repeats